MVYMTHEPTLPAVVYPTLIPSSTPTELPGMICDSEPVDVVCKATVCVVRKEPKSGENNKAYTVPNSTIITGAVVCVCPSCAPIEQKWFYLGNSGDEQFWAIQMDQVWETIGD